ncbi:hypothetical protein [Sphingorhabdus sp. M41]|uniref:hypothetical protein n=1 Tax=Sphingorhabdus sp. M41 TaxID=1806885 RepID=UPI00078C7F7B|nr:hypothetical protein [Sphingorhabdus sp. M41]AMO70707.1 hypothetical protein AZE99_01540 [Sphingorhabdus sp. M41]
MLDTGLNGWTETVWYHGEEVGERTRFSPGLLLAALARLDAKADGMDMAGDPAREAAADFEEMVEAIGDGKDCTAMLEAQDQAAKARRAPAPRSGLAGLSEAEIISRIEMFDERERILETAPEDIDTSDLDPYEADDWDELQWARAERSGMTAEPGFWEKANPDGSDRDDEWDQPAEDRPGENGPGENGSAEDDSSFH